MPCLSLSTKYTQEADGAFCVCMPLQMRSWRGTLLSILQLPHHYPPFELAGGFPLPVKAQLQHTFSRVTLRTQAGLIRRSAKREEKKKSWAWADSALISATPCVYFLFSPYPILFSGHQRKTCTTMDLSTWVCRGESGGWTQSQMWRPCSTSSADPSQPCFRHFLELASPQMCSSLALGRPEITQKSVCKI